MRVEFLDKGAHVPRCDWVIAPFFTWEGSDC